MFGPKMQKMWVFFTHLKVVGGCRETQLQVGKNLT